jgi:phosphoglycerate kinase
MDIPLKLKTLDSFQYKAKKVLIRADLNVPMHHGTVSDATRIERVIPTIKEILKFGNKVIVCSHFGRPEGRFEPSMSLAPLVDPLSERLGMPVKFASDCVGKYVQERIASMDNGEVMLLENLRFHAGEEENNPEFAQQLADLADVFVNDAFSCSHRAHASISGVAEILPCFAGRLLQEEVEVLTRALNSPKRPLAAIVGGSKISTKLKLLKNLVNKVDILIIGGGMANTFLHAQGVNIQKSLHEPDLKEIALKVLAESEKSGCRIILPIDAVCATVLAPKVGCKVVDVHAIPDDHMILDVGTATISLISEALAQCKTIVWNGPLGAFETSPFDVGTASLSRVIAAHTAAGGYSVAGGGDTVSALFQAGLAESLSYLSTAGGAFLEWLEGRRLPGVEALYETDSSSTVGDDLQIVASS